MFTFSPFPPDRKSPRMYVCVLNSTLFCYLLCFSPGAQQQSGYQPPAPVQPPAPAQQPSYTPPSVAPAPAALAPVQQYRSPSPPQQSYSPPPPAAPQGGYQPPVVGGGAAAGTRAPPAKVASAVSDPAAMGEVQQREVSQSSA